MQISSETKRVELPADALYRFLNDFRHFGQLLPEQVKDWQATPEQCSFAIEGMAKIALVMGECREYDLVTYQSSGATPISFSILFKINPNLETQTDYTVEMHADMNPMLEMMARKPLQHLVDVMAEKLQVVIETNQDIR
ncbi:MAG TPA: hypothetical protein PLE85_08935 [Bacteroidales bacterium]|nr:hypothetical protein [Lentimicrobiaceae bacterium]HOI00648.1 hypothetical protein [Bacteroidales bacterium]